LFSALGLSVCQPHQKIVTQEKKKLTKYVK